MSDLVNKAYQATPNATLRDQIMNPNFPKNEREWWAADRIEQLEAEVRTWQGHARTAIWSDSEECKFLTARIEQLEAALRMIRDNEPERLAWSVGYARAALEVHSIGHEDGLRPRERA